MADNIKSLIKAIIEKRRLDKELEKELSSNSNYIFNPSADIFSQKFGLTSISISINVIRSISFAPDFVGVNIIELDNEDLDYLYNKYLPKLKDELDSNVEELKKEYELSL